MNRQRIWMQWIPVSEPPKDYKNVLVTRINGAQTEVIEAYYDPMDGSWHDLYSRRIDVTAWMELPEPWKGEQP